MRTRDTTPAFGIATFDGQRYALTNFVLYADDAAGKPAWKSVNEKGGMYPGPARGTRKLGSLDFFTRVSSGAFVSEGKGLMMVASHHHAATDGEHPLAMLALPPL